MLILNEVDKYAYSSTILLDSTKLTNDWGIILLTYSPSNQQYQLQIAFPDHGFYILPSKYQISPPMTSDFTLPTPSFTQYLAWNAQYQTLFLYLHHELYVIHLEWYHLFHQTSISYQELALLLTTKGTSSTSTDSELCFNQIDVRFHLYSKEMILGQCLSMNLSTPTAPSMMILISSQCFCHILLSFQPTNSSSSSTSHGFPSLDPSFTSHSSYLHIQKHLQITKHMIYLSENHGDRQLLPVWQTNLLSWQLIPQETPSFEHSEHNKPEHKQEYLQCSIQQIHWLESISSYWIVYEDGSFVLYHITQHHNSSVAYNSSLHTSSLGYSSTTVSAASLAASNANIASMEHISPLYRTTRAYMIIQSAYPLKSSSTSSTQASQRPCCHEYHSFVHHNNPNTSPNTPTNTSMANNTHHMLSSNTQYTTKEEIISFVKEQRDLNHRPLLNTLTKTQVKALTNGIQHEEITNISDLIIISEDVSSGQIKYMMLLMTRHLVEYIEEHTSECIDVTYSLAIGVLQQQITTTFPSKSNQINPLSASIFKQMQCSFIQIINLSQVSFPRMMVSGVLQRFSSPSAYSTPQSTPDADSSSDSPPSMPPLSKRVRKHHLELIKSKLSSTPIGKNTRGSSSTATTPSASSSFFPATPRRSFTYDDQQQQTVLQSPSFGDPMITPTTPTSTTSSSSSTSSNYHIFVSIDDKIFSIDYYDSYVHTEQDSLVFQSSFQTPWKTPPPLPSLSPPSTSSSSSTTNYAYSRVLYCQNKLLFLQNEMFSSLLTTSKLRLSIFPILHQVNNVYPMLTSSINAMLTPLQHQLDMISTQETTLSYYLNQREGYLLIKQPCSSTYSSSFSGSDEENQETIDPLEINSTSKHTNPLSTPPSIPMKTYSLLTLQHPSSSTDFIAKGSHQLMKIMLPKSLYFSGLIQHFQIFSSSNMTWFGIHDNQNHRLYTPSPVRFDTHEELHSYFVCYQSMISASTMSMMIKNSSFVSNTLQTMLKNIDYLNTTGQEIWIYNRNTFRWRSMTLSNASIGLLTDIPSIESYYTMPYMNNNMLNSASNSSNMLLSKGNNTSSHSLLSSSLDDYDDSLPNSRMNSLDLTPIEEETEDESSNSSKNNNKNNNNNSHGFNYSDLFLVTSPTHNDNHHPNSNNHTNSSTANINRPPKIPIHQYKYMGKVYPPASTNIPGQSTPSLNIAKENDKDNNNKKKDLQKKKPWEKKTKWISITNRPQLLQSPCLILASYWYDNHTLLLITIRKRQYYLEIISREPLITSSTAGVLTKPPKVHRMIALPLGFKPSFIDVVLENHRTSSSTSSTSFMAEDGSNNNPTDPLPNTPCTSAIIMLSDGQYILTYWIQAIIQSIIPSTSSTSSSTSTINHTTTSSTLESLTLDEENINSGYQGIIHQSSVKTNVLDYRIVELWNLQCNQLIFDPFTTSQWNIHCGLSHDTSTLSTTTTSSAENIPIPEHRLTSFQSIHIYHIQYPFYSKYSYIFVHNFFLFFLFYRKRKYFLLGTSTITRYTIHCYACCNSYRGYSDD